MAKGKPAIVTKILIYSVVLNIILNILAILLFRNSGDLAIVYGVAVATIVSNWFYLIGLIIGKKRSEKSLELPDGNK